MSIQINQCSHAFGRTSVLHDINLEVPVGEFVALLGPSGSGKSTLLRLVAGLEPMQRGQLLIGDEDCTDSPVQKRGVGLVFQHYALFPHLNVRENIAFGLRLRARRGAGLDEAQISERVQHMLSLVELGGFEDRRPSELSGGQQQRVALARALVVEPRVLLLDEPFGALDARVRTALRREVRDLHDRLGMTTLLVTHDQAEAVDVADRLVLLQEGRVIQQGAPDDLFSEPVDRFVCEFLGEVNWLDGQTLNGVVTAHGLELEGCVPFDGKVHIGVRPRQFQLDTEADAGLPVLVQRVRHLGRTTRVDGQVDGRSIMAEVARSRESECLTAGMRVRLRVKRAHVFPAEGTSVGSGSWLVATPSLTQSEQGELVGETGLVH